MREISPSRRVPAGFLISFILLLLAAPIAFGKNTPAAPQYQNGTATTTTAQPETDGGGGLGDVDLQQVNPRKWSESSTTRLSGTLQSPRPVSWKTSFMVKAEAIWDAFVVRIGAYKYALKLENR